MDIISLLVLLVVIGAVLYLVNLIPMDNTIRKIIQVVAIVAVAIFLIRSFIPGLLGHRYASVIQTISQPFKQLA